MLMSQQRSRGQHGEGMMRPVSLECLPEDVLLQIVKPLALYDKMRLQLVSKKLYALLLSPPPGEGLWGEFDLSGEISDYVEGLGNFGLVLGRYCTSDAGAFLDPEARRWLVRRVPHMTRISCDTLSDEAAWMLPGVLPELSGLIGPAAVLSMWLNSRFTEELLYCEPGKQPNDAMIDFWHPLVDCLTELEINTEVVKPESRLQPQLLNQLTALTKLTLNIESHADGLEAHILKLPELRSLCVDTCWNSRMVLECPRLTDLTLHQYGACRVFLQAPLQRLWARSSDGFTLHPDFPVSNFLDLVSLSICCPNSDDEGALFSVLPLMEKLQTLDLGVYQGWLLRSLPQSLCEVALEYLSSAGWDDRVIPALKHLPELHDLKIIIRRRSGDTLATLSSDLRPFMAMQQLCTFQVGPRKAWTPDSLRALEQFETELVNSGNKLKLTY